MFALFKKNKTSETKSQQGELIWACDYCCFIYYTKTDVASAYLEIVGAGRSEELICEVGRGDEFADYEVQTREEALDSGLDVLHLFDVMITYDGQSDADFRCEYGEYGSNSDWLTRQSN